MTDETTKEEAKTEDEGNLNIVDEARKIRDEILEAKDKLKEEREGLEKVRSEELLSSSAGGHIEPKLISPEDKKVNDAKEFFKGTELETAITKANETGS